MAKRSPNTELPNTDPKKSATPPARGKLAREYRSRAEREAEIQRYVVLGTGAVIGLSALILVIFFIYYQFIVPNQAVATVNGENITVSQFEKRVRFERFILNNQLNNALVTYQSFGMDPNQIISQEPFSTWWSEIQLPDQLGNRVINQMVDDAIIRQQANTLGISVSQEDIQKKINEYFSYDPETAGLAPTPTLTPTITPTPFVSPTPSPTPTITPSPTTAPTSEATAEATGEATAEVTPTLFPTLEPTPTQDATQRADQFQTDRNDYYTAVRDATGLSDADINNFFEMQAIRDAVRDQIASDVTDQGIFVDARHILVATQEEAEDILAALEAGESFADLARAVSTDTGSGAQGGDLGWTSVTDFVTPFADAVTNAPIGETVGPVESEFGFHIIQVRAREERPLEENQQESAKERVFEEWLTGLKETETPIYEIYPNWTGVVPSDPPFVYQGAA
jgi:peptidyl-prolyl cis-trans isomerase D